MNVLLVVMLAGLWVWLLSPGVLRERRPRSPLPSVDSFERYMDTLAPLSERPIPSERPPRHLSPRARAARRRRQVFTWLAGAVPPALVLAILAGGRAWFVPLMVTVALGAYTVALVAFRRRREVQARVARLPRPDRPPQREGTAEQQRRRAQEA